MERKRSGVGIAAGILFGISLLYSVAAELTFVFRSPAVYLNIGEFFWWLGNAAGWCVSVFIIISLFREQRSKLLIAAYGINILMILRDFISAAIDGDFIWLLLSATTLLGLASTMLCTVMVIFCCVPSLQEYAGWTGKIWFLPPVLDGIMVILDIWRFWKLYRENLVYHPLWTAGQLFINLLGVVSILLFCLWLTEPMRNAPKINLQK